MLAGCGDDDSSATPDAGARDDASAPTQDSGPPGCAPGTSMCGDICADTDSSRAHCGECGNACAAGEACLEGSCAIVCPGSQSACDGVCADLDSDRRHCGECGATCDAGELCVDGACAVSCPSGQTLCGTTCVDTQSEPSHCGECGNACDAGEVCSEGTCAATCSSGLTECDDACVDTNDDPSNCGACGNECATEADGAGGACIAGSCRTLCEPGYGDCDADLTSATGNGCETAVSTDVTNCGACGNACDLANATAGCDAGGCVIATCDEGFLDCDTSPTNGCEVSLADDAANCGACGNACAAGEVCGAGACVVPAGEDCGNPIALTPGRHVLTWTAADADYITSTPACGAGYAPAGPDVVFSYTNTSAAQEWISTFFEKPEGARWHALVTTGAACGTLDGALCTSDFYSPFLGGGALLAPGQTAHLYLIDSVSGGAPLSRPLTVDFDATACDATPSMTRLIPANGGTTPIRAATFTAQFSAPAVPGGTVTITGNMGTALSYPVGTEATAPARLDEATRTILTIDPGISFPPGEQLTISWTGLNLRTCSPTTSVPAPTPTWQVTVRTPPCTPGMAGMIGDTVAIHSVGGSYAAEQYVAADSDPNGYVYVGGTAALWRFPKAGGAGTNLVGSSPITSDHLGYAMLIDGQNIFTVESDSAPIPTGHLYRVSTDGGATWSVEEYMEFSVAPNDDFRGVTISGDRIYLVTHEDSTATGPYPAQPTQIWSVPRVATTLPVEPVLELEVAEGDCTSVVRDASFYYLVCDGAGAIIRYAHDGTGRRTMPNRWHVETNATVNALHGSDTDADGVFDVLYYRAAAEQIDYVCNPATSPYVDHLVRFSTVTASAYGLGLDPVGGVLWSYDDDTYEIVSVQ
ncbi:Tryptophan synthase alpha chain [Sandaracinus amylolyticus]|uniref:Tryptophan synthase alpha chain n=1 Tax=Sandaracinus amylolyticus TaxID=927083 RepID=A0A0F6W5V3_9BACT|nr:Tryptophan synthase alpha chain [Sandaracinus amylolyticus]